MARLEKIERHLEQFLHVGQFSDACPNGVQVRGRRRIRKIVTGVSASLELFQVALERKGDAILVHHGLIWDKDSRIIEGSMRRRLGILLKHDLTLLAYHLPLDAHPGLGNNVLLLRGLGIEKLEPFGHYHHQNISFMGSLNQGVSLEKIIKRVKKTLPHATPMVLPWGGKKIVRIAVCSGGAPELIREAKARGADLFLTGEVGEPIHYLAREEKIHCIAAGHHATETLGVHALGDHLARKFGIGHHFHDTRNPF
ncbi:MAG: Nif3-like dinuclear metal center hexameric protein [Magnetococcales bacterium]|nr:Nif3-like dinuclear metal center hexameric protein [Magnetococcales bacterium]